MFNVAEVESRVQSTLVTSNNDPEDARQIYLAEIMDWSDFYTENSEASTTEKDKVFAALVDLWLHSVRFEISLHQFKRAVDRYEQAIADPVVGHSSQVFQSYADFCVERNKKSNAQKVYLKALCAGLPQKDNSILWHNFLRLTHSTSGSSAMTLEELYSASKKQLGDAADALAPVDVVAEVKAEVGIKSEAVPDPTPVVVAVEVSHSLPEFNFQRISTSQPLSSGEQEEGSDDLDSLVGFTPEQVIRVFDKRPPLIFSAPNKEPMSAGIGALGVSEVRELEAFLGGGMTLVALQGSEGHLEQRRLESLSAADKYLDLLEALWTAQAMKERHFDSWISDLSVLHLKEESDFLDSLARREAPGTSERDLLARHAAEAARFSNRCEVQKELLNAVVNKALFALLLEQQMVLSQLRFPHFSPSVVDRIEAHLKKQATGSKAASFLAAQAAEFLHISEIVGRQQRLVCALLSIRLSAVQYQRNKVHSHHLKQQRLQRGNSLDMSGGDPDTPIGEDYYSQEAKERRRKQRRLAGQGADASTYGHSAVSSYDNSVGSPRHVHQQQLLSGYN